MGADVASVTQRVILAPAVRSVRWTVALILLAAVGVGTVAGIGGYTFVYARGGSYLSDDARACVNCHVMRPQFDGWERSSHAAVATCNDCHTPTSFFDHWFVKASNGWHHSYAFTTGDFDEPIQITPGNLAVTEQACRGCHGELVAQVDAFAHPGADPVSCTRCHRSVGHPHVD